MLLFYFFQTREVHNFFKLTSQKRLRRHYKKLNLPHCQTRIHHNLFRLRVISTWNALPEEIMHSSSENYFQTPPRFSLRLANLNI